MGGEILQRVHVPTDGAQVCAAGVQVIHLAHLGLLDAGFDLRHAGAKVKVWPTINVKPFDSLRSSSCSRPLPWWSLLLDQDVLSGCRATLGDA